MSPICVWGWLEKMWLCLGLLVLCFPVCLEAQFQAVETGIHVDVPKFFHGNQTWVVPVHFEGRLLVPIYTNSGSTLACTGIDSLCCLHQISGVTSRPLQNLLAKVGPCDAMLQSQTTETVLTTVNTTSIAAADTFFNFTQELTEMYLQIPDSELAGITTRETGLLARQVLTLEFLFIDPTPSPFAYYHSLQQTVIFYDKTKLEGPIVQSFSFTSTCPNSKPAHSLWYPDGPRNGSCSWFCRVGYLECRDLCILRPPYGSRIVFQSSGLCPTDCLVQFNGSHYTAYSSDHNTIPELQISRLQASLHQNYSSCNMENVSSRILEPPPPPPVFPVRDLVIVSVWGVGLMALLCTGCWLFIKSIPGDEEHSSEYRNLRLPGNILKSNK